MQSIIKPKFHTEERALHFLCSITYGAVKTWLLFDFFNETVNPYGFLKLPMRKIPLG
jgi:hypothetical protein